VCIKIKILYNKISSSEQYRLAGSIVAYDKGERFVEFDDVSVLGAEAANALNEELVDGRHLTQQPRCCNAPRRLGGKREEGGLLCGLSRFGANQTKMLAKSARLHFLFLE
jgi:hypothetical protein